MGRKPIYNYLDTLVAIVDFYYEYDYMPSYDQLVAKMGMKTKCVLTNHFRRLITDGYIHKHGSWNRSAVITTKGYRAYDLLTGKQHGH